MNRKIFLMLSFLIIPLLLMAQSYVQKMKDGAMAFDKGDYEQANKSYYDIIQNDNSSSEELARAYYNIGNSFCKKGQWADAVGAFQKALELKPSDAAAQYNMTFAKNKIPPQDQSQKPDQKGQKPDQKPDQEEKPEPPQQQQPKPSTMDKNQAEQMLKALREEETRIQKEGQKAGPLTNGKNW